ncbi:dCTP deaminase domain-containing protein, partial [Mammaliicoccus sciuri]|uniref:dCTP deaminase domain-containing protein n=1 Tax=Mammaliicoccus sciuri TaxID=1296 RepID=UPI00289E1970
MTNTLQVKLLSKDARMPERNHKTDAGYDIFSAKTVVLEPQEKAVIKTDVAVSIPEGYVGLLTSRSGVSSKTHLVIETGKIDAGYHGNLGINIKNENETLENWVTYNFSRDVAGIYGKYVLPPVTDKIL